MSTKWSKTPLRDLISIKHGFSFKGEFFVKSIGDIVLTPGNFRETGGLKFRSEKDRSYKGEYPAEFRLKDGDLLVVMTDLTQDAPILGAAAFVPDGLTLLHNQRLGKITILDEKKLDRRFLYYIFNSRAFRLAVKGSASGATVRHTSPSRICDVGVPLPPLAVQRRIASILGAYDDLIEVNHRRIAGLAEMAQRLFQEWFVNFRYPTGGKATVASEVLSLPAGWTWGRLDDLLVLQRGFDLPTDKRSPGPYPVISASGVHGYHNVAKVKGPGVVTGRSGTIGEVMLLQEDFWALNTTLYVKEFRRATPTFAYFVLRNLSLKDRSGGAAVPSLNRNHIHGLKSIVPTSESVARFDEIATPIFRHIKVCELQQANLAASRDLLLPRLISGDLSVIAAEREIEQAA